MQTTINLSPLDSQRNVGTPKGPRGASQDKRTLEPRESIYVPEVTQYSYNLAPGLPPSMCGLTVTSKSMPTRMSIFGRRS